MRNCKSCQDDFPLDHFYVSIENNRTRYRCKTVTRNYQKSWRQEETNKTKRRVTEREYVKSYPAKRLLINAKRRAKVRNLPFDIELEDIVIPELCPILQIPLFVGDGVSPNSPSLDRLVPELGYVKGNVKVISYLANTMKQNATPEQLTTFASNIGSYLTS